MVLFSKVAVRTTSLLGIVRVVGFAKVMVPALVVRLVSTLPSAGFTGANCICTCWVFAAYRTPSQIKPVADVPFL